MATCSFAQQRIQARGYDELPEPDSLKWALICPAVFVRFGTLSTRLTCPVQPERRDHYGCVDGMHSDIAERHDSYNGPGAWQHCCTHGLKP